MQTLKGMWRRAAAAVVGLTVPLATATPAFAAGSGVSITPNKTGLPGISQFETIVGSVITLGVIASVAGLGMSAVAWAIGNHSANPQVAGRGKSGVLVAAAAAIICGGAMAIVNFFFNIGTQL